MKLLVKTGESVPVLGGVAIFLCDEMGNSLPNQCKATLTTEVDELPRLVVEFLVDGETISIVKSAER